MNELIKPEKFDVGDIIELQDDAANFMFIGSDKLRCKDVPKGTKYRVKSVEYKDGALHSIGVEKLR